MAKKMKAAALSSTFFTMLCAVFYRNTQNDLVLTLAITFGTVSYHLLMRLLVGFAINRLLHNRVDHQAKWFHISAAEEKLYKMLRVKMWKGKMATYDPSAFDRRLHSWDEIAQATCQAELVHELIIPLSFVPLLASIPFGAFGVFAVTSLLSACYDAMFVIMQRFNRPRILRLAKNPGKHTGMKQSS